MAHEVFISYSKSDKTVADAACAALERRGLRVWIAPRDVNPGADWGESIVDAITNSRAMVLILSASSNDSPQVRREVQRAFEHNITVIPFRVENVVPARALEYYIGPVHWLDALTPPLEAHLGRLCDSVHRLLSAAPQTPTLEPQRPLASTPAAPAAEASPAAPAASTPTASQRTQRRMAASAWALALGVAVLALGVLGALVLRPAKSESPLPSAAPPTVSPPAAPARSPYHGILDGDWTVTFARPDGSRYRGQLTMAGDTGTVTMTQTPERGPSRTVKHAVQIVPLDKGFAVRPVGAADAAADTLVFLPAGDSFRVGGCDERAFEARSFTSCPFVTVREAQSRS
jgi:hypothetical protein